jgi:hypothetical protein
MAGISPDSSVSIASPHLLLEGKEPCYLSFHHAFFGGQVDVPVLYLGATMKTATGGSPPTTGVQPNNALSGNPGEVCTP